MKRRREEDEEEKMEEEKEENSGQEPQILFSPTTSSIGSVWGDQNKYENINNYLQQEQKKFDEVALEEIIKTGGVLQEWSLLGIVEYKNNEENFNKIKDDYYEFLGNIQNYPTIKNLLTRKLESLIKSEQTENIFTLCLEHIVETTDSNEHYDLTLFTEIFRKTISSLGEEAATYMLLAAIEKSIEADIVIFFFLSKEENTPIIQKHITDNLRGLLTSSWEKGSFFYFNYLLSLCDITNDKNILFLEEDDDLLIAQVLYEPIKDGYDFLEPILNKFPGIIDDLLDMERVYLKMLVEYALITKNETLIKKIRDKNIDIGKLIGSCFYNICNFKQHGNVEEFFKLLIAYKANINILEKVGTKEDSKIVVKDTPLVTAIESFDSAKEEKKDDDIKIGCQLILTLLNHGANPFIEIVEQSLVLNNEIVIHFVNKILSNENLNEAIRDKKDEYNKQLSALSYGKTFLESMAIATIQQTILSSRVTTYSSSSSSSKELAS